MYRLVLRTLPRIHCKSRCKGGPAAAHNEFSARTLYAVALVLWRASPKLLASTTCLLSELWRSLPCENHATDNHDAPKGTIRTQLRKRIKSTRSRHCRWVRARAGMRKSTRTAFLFRSGYG